MADGQQSWLDSLSAAIPAVGQIITEGARAYDAVYNSPRAAAPATPSVSTGPIVPSAPAGPQVQLGPAAAGSSGAGGGSQAVLLLGVAMVILLLLRKG